MYKKFFGLSRNPFEISPDPYFFYPTPSHNEALASLTYGVYKRKGFVVVTGEVGTGKTLLIRFLLEALNRNQVASAFVYNPRLSVLDFLIHVLTDFRIPITGRTKAEMLSTLNNYLLSRSRNGGITALVVDEAQLLNWELLEEIRLMTNLETSQHKLIQIILVGQPELDQKLDSQNLRQLKQRVALRCSLRRLALDDLRGYIYRRLELAGAHGQTPEIFPEETIAAVHRNCQGIPRLANTLCENSLISAFSRQVKQVTPEIVEEVAITFRLNVVSQTSDSNPDAAEQRTKMLELLSQIVAGMSVPGQAPEMFLAPQVKSE